MLFLLDLAFRPVFAMADKVSRAVESLKVMPR